MKIAGILIFGTLSLVACGGGQSQTTAPRDIPRPTSAVDEQKVRCVAQGGFLVPSGGDFACRLENGQTVGLYSL